MNVALSLITSLLAVSAGDPDPVVWHPVTVREARSEGGATFTLEGGGAVHLGGENPDKDVHTLLVESALTRVTGLWIEALPADDLGGKGPGRSGNGNFVLGEVTVEAGSAAGLPQLRDIPLAHATASFCQHGHSAAATIDGNAESGWAVYPRAGSSHVLVVELDDEVEHRGGVLLRVTLTFPYGSRHVLGHYRIQVTDAPRPLYAPPNAKDRPWTEIQPDIDRAIDRGVGWLIDHQGRDGSWSAHRDGYPTGQTALALYTLLKSGVRRDHPAVRRAADFVRARVPRKTYENACQILALCALDDPADHDRVQENVDLMVSWQRRDGGYAYPDGAEDLSNTQYAAFSLNVAAEHGYRVPRSLWTEIGKWVLERQEPTRSPYDPAGFSYRGGDNARGSMTAAGAGVLAICLIRLEREGTRFRPPFERSIGWLVRHYTVTGNAATRGASDGNNLYYYLYGLERVGALADLERLGEHDWYQDGARFLVEKQDGNGAWSSDNQTDTCFALLFLGRATRSVTGAVTRGAATYGDDDPEQEVSLRAAGDTPLTVWVSSFGTRISATLAPEGGELPVEAVRFFAAPAAGGDEVLMDEVILPPDAARLRRLATQLEFPRNGRYAVRAEVDVPDPDDATVLHTLASAALEVDVREVLDPEVLHYGSDVDRNLLRDVPVEVRASSQFDDGWSAGRVLDGFLDSGWLSKDGDNLPTLDLVLEQPVRANTLLLSPAVPPDAERTGRIRVLRVEVNGKGDPIDVRLDPDDAHKTRVTLPRTTVVRRLHLAVVETSPGHPKKDAVGLAEVELQMVRSGSR